MQDWPRSLAARHFEKRGKMRHLFSWPTAARRIAWITLGLFCTAGIVWLYLVAADNCFFSPALRERRCLNNLLQIDAAKTIWAQECGASNGTTVPVAELWSLGAKTPSCPEGGSYEVNVLGRNPTCSVHGDLLRAELEEVGQPDQSLDGADSPEE